ncbi:MAG: TonB family protein [Deltaproteobacteria bacterium]|nr:TonB family protein [Deltaproteobacteria bacterium]
MNWPETMRRSYDSGVGLQAMVFLSLGLHAMVLSLVLFPSMFPTPRWTFGPVYSVQLVGTLPGGSSTPADGLSSFERGLLKSAPREPAIIPFKKAAPSSAVPIARIDVRKRRDINIDGMMEDFKRRRATATKTPVPAMSQAPAGHGKAVSAGQADRRIALKMEDYYARIWSQIKGHWVLPSGMIPLHDLEAVLHARISKYGTLNGVSFEKRSGNRYFDESVIKALRKAAPLPPLPEVLREDSIEIGIRFHSRDIR